MLSFRKNLIFPLLLITFICIFFTTIPNVVNADTGPKSCIEIEFENISDDYYVTLLYDTEIYGPFHTFDGNPDQLDEILTKFINYNDPDSFNMLISSNIDDIDYDICNNTIKKINKENPIFGWYYMRPEIFKVLIYSPSKDKFFSSAITNTYAFNSYYKIDINEMLKNSEINNKNEIIIQKSYNHSMEIMSLILRIIITITIEVALAYMFGFRAKNALKFIMIVNLITQATLNIYLNVLSYKEGWILMMISYIFIEFIITAFETILYMYKLPKYNKNYRKSKIAIYGIMANIASYVIGAYIISIILK